MNDKKISKMKYKANKKALEEKNKQLELENYRLRYALKHIARQSAEALEINSLEIKLEEETKQTVKCGSCTKILDLNDEVNTRYHPESMKYYCLTCWDPNWGRKW